MPDEQYNLQSRLTPEDKKRVQDWFNSNCKGGHPPCPMCNCTDWVIGPLLAHVPGYQRRNLLPSTTYPVVAVVCYKCSHFSFFSAAEIGVISADEPREDDSKESPNG